MLTWSLVITSGKVIMTSFKQRDGFVSINSNLTLPNSFDYVSVTPAYSAQSCMRACSQMSTCGIAWHSMSDNTSKCTRFFIEDTTYKCYLKHSPIVFEGSIGGLHNVTNYTLEECKDVCFKDDKCIGVNFKDPNICIPIHVEGPTTDTFMWLQNKTELDKALPDVLSTRNGDTSTKSSIYIIVCVIISLIVTSV
jgi:hypothetical protein